MITEFFRLSDEDKIVFNLLMLNNLFDILSSENVTPEEILDSINTLMTNNEKLEEYALDESFSQTRMKDSFV